MKTIVSSILFTAAMSLSSGVMAVSTFNLYDGVDPGACTQNSGATAGNFGNSYSCSQQTTSADEVKINAYSTTGAGGKYAAAHLGNYSPSGFGVSSTTEGLRATSPNHSLDNSGSIDGMLLSFNSSIALSSLTIGWKYNDADFSVYAWRGTTGSALTDLTNSTATSLAGGWTLVGSYADAVANNAVAINSGAVSSSYWLVSAYNASTGGASLNGGAIGTAAADYFKLASIAGNFTCVNSNSPACNSSSSVPEPASLAMVAFGLLGAFGTRRRYAAKLGAKQA